MRKIIEVEIEKPEDFDGSISCKFIEGMAPFCQIEATAKTVGIWKFNTFIAGEIWNQMVDQLNARHPHGNILVSRDLRYSESWKKTTVKFRGLFLLGAQEKEPVIAKAIDREFSVKNGVQYAILEAMTANQKCQSIVEISIPAIGIYRVEAIGDVSPIMLRQLQLVFLGCKSDGRKEILYKKQMAGPYVPEGNWEKVSRHAPVEHLLRFYQQLRGAKNEKI